AGECAVVGDRLETDIAMARSAGLASVLVLTGVTRPDDPEIARWRPDHVIASLAALLDGMPEPGGVGR
ncbi:MAG: HAD hydrolase-like protein, partial [Candidatus Rokuibacteriota bacterium]